MRNKKEDNKQKEKNLSGSDIILNLKEISIGPLDSFSSSSCSGNSIFYIDCSTPQGYCEDPNFSGTINILDVRKIRNFLEHPKNPTNKQEGFFDVKKDKPRNIYCLKIKFEKKQEEK